jgi:hypothetical protein
MGYSIAFGGRAFPGAPANNGRKRMAEEVN